MALVYLDCRATLGYVTDPANSVAFLGSDMYPTTRGGLTFGWVGGTLPSFDVSTGADPHLAGFHYRTNSAGPATFQLDLGPLGGAGTYNIGIAMGSAGDAEPQQYATANGGVICANTGGPAAYNYVDASNAIVAGAAWTATQTLYGTTVAGSSLLVTIGNTAGGAFLSCLACLYVEFVSGGGGGGGGVGTDDEGGTTFPTQLMVPTPVVNLVTVFCRRRAA